VREGPYAGADTVLSRRFALFIQALGVPVPLALALLYPPTAAIGVAGWIVTAALLLVVAAGVVALGRARGAAVFRVHLATVYSQAAALAIAQWLGGGWEAPYHQLYLALLLTTAMIHTPRHALVFYVAVVAATLAPVAYGQTDGRLGDVLVALGLWLLVVLFSSAMMVRLRAQRTLLLLGQDEAQDAARHDALTGLANRRAFEEAVAAALARAGATGRPLTLAVGDVDRFKAINDRYGHPAGDACLRAIAAALTSASRSADRVFRWGGDEFAVLIENATPDEGAATCARLEQEVRATVHTPAGAPVSVTFGWAATSAAGDGDALVAAADAALLQRKRARPAAAA
jgi:diguanylate cyclase (GGDEF)-like protein